MSREVFMPIKTICNGCFGDNGVHECDCGEYYCINCSKFINCDFCDDDHLECLDCARLCVGCCEYYVCHRCAVDWKCINCKKC